MRVNFSIYNFSKPSFSQNSKSYNYGFNHGKNDGIVGVRSDAKKNVEFEIDSKDYEKGYSRGYNLGKSQRQCDTTTVSDIIQDLVDKGTSRDEAIKFVSQYLGGW